MDTLRYVFSKIHVIILSLIFITILGYFFFVRYPLTRAMEITRIDIDNKNKLLSEQKDKVNNMDAILKVKSNTEEGLKNLLNEFPKNLNSQIILYKMISLAEDNNIELETSLTVTDDILDIVDDEYREAFNELFNEPDINIPAVSLGLGIRAAEFENITSFIHDIEKLERGVYIGQGSITADDNGGYSCSVVVIFSLRPEIDSLKGGLE